MKVLKGIAWGLPAVALVAGAFVLMTGFSGTVVGADLPAPIAAPAVEAGQPAAAANGETWDQMADPIKGCRKF